MAKIGHGGFSHLPTSTLVKDCKQDSKAAEFCEFPFC